MAEPDTEKKKKDTSSSSSSSSSTTSLDYSLLADSVSKLLLSPSPSTTKEHIIDWSLLPEELLHIISTHLEKNGCFVDEIHARSVCNSWRSTFPYPSSILRQSYSVPAYPRKSNDFFTVEKIPLFLYRAKTQTQPSDYFLGGISRDDHHHTELLQSPIQCSVKANLPKYDPTVMNMVDYQILPLGHRYRIVGKDPEGYGGVKYRGVAFLPLNNDGSEGGGEEGFVVILNYSRFFLVLRSSNMRWVRFKRLSDASCVDLFTFKGMFFANFLNGDIFLIDPYSLETFPLRPPQDLKSVQYLVPFGDEELFLVEKVVPDINDVIDFTRSGCRVSKLDQRTFKWVVVSDLGDRVLFIGEFGNVGCSSKELPVGCGLSGNSILFIDWPGEGNYVYKYGVNQEYDLGLWGFSSEYRVLFSSEYRVVLRNRSPPVVAFRVEREEP